MGRNALVNTANEEMKPRRTTRAFKQKNDPPKRVKELLTVPSARAEMTFPRDDRDLLMFLASSSTDPSAPVLLT